MKGPVGERSEPRQGEELCFGVALLFGGEPCGLVGGRGWSEHQGTGRVPPKWSPWLFSFDVIRNTTSPKSFLLVRHESLCPLATLCMACVRFKAKGVVLALPGQWDLIEAGEGEASHSLQERLHLRVCPCFDFLCSVVILEQKLVQLFN